MAERDGWGLPVLMVSAKSAPADIARARDLGGSDLLAKPFDGDDLVRRVAARLVP